ncbi:MAG: hypothetical protein GY694_18700 [Gammaproteobacteria bacterium]|nr:hypothetical protein [Gammaproteobacteria bacterium]
MKKVNAQIVGDKKTNGFFGEIIIPNVCEEITKRSVDNVCKLYCVNNNQPGKICIDKNLPCDFLM